MSVVLVTGAAGAVGSEIVKTLDQAGLMVVALDTMALPALSARGVSVQADLLGSDWRDALKGVKPQVIVHCAARLPRTSSAEEDALSASVNRKLDDQIINYASENSCRLLYASGTSVYGLSDDFCDENRAPCPQSLYVKAKWETEKKIELLVPNHIILRLSSPYSPAQRAKIVLHKFIDNALSNLDLTYFGSGLREQDFIAAQDVARAIECVIQKPNVCGIFNIASANPISMRDLAHLVVKWLTASTSRVVAADQIDPQEHYRPRFDITKARSVLGWAPQVDIEDGVSLLIQMRKK